MLVLGDYQSSKNKIVLNPTLVSVFGLTVQTSVTEETFLGPPVTYELDSYEVKDYGVVSELTCSCSRTTPQIVASEDLLRAHRVTGFYACPTCQEEDKNAHSSSDHIAVWIAQNRTRINETEHLYLPSVFKRLVDKEGTIMRPRRFIYSKFHGVKLSTKDKILNTCSDTQCINPYHMMHSLSPATKVTPQMKEDIHAWVHKKISNRLIQSLLTTKYHKQISLRTITNLKRSVLV